MNELFWNRAAIVCGGFIIYYLIYIYIGIVNGIEDGTEAIKLAWKGKHF